MRYSLITVTEQDGDIVSGVWLQNHIGTLETATERAISTMKVNSNRITIAIVDEVTSPTPWFSNIFKVKAHKILQATERR